MLHTCYTHDACMCIPKQGNITSILPESSIVRNHILDRLLSIVTDNDTRRAEINENECCHSPSARNSSQPATFEQAIGISLRWHTQAVTLGSALPPPLDRDVLSWRIDAICLTARHNLYAGIPNKQWLLEMPPQHRLLTVTFWVDESNLYAWLLGIKSIRRQTQKATRRSAEKDQADASDAINESSMT
jgi:hypothetical protein